MHIKLRFVKEKKTSNNAQDVINQYKNQLMMLILEMVVMKD